MKSLFRFIASAALCALIPFCASALPIRFGNNVSLPPINAFPATIAGNGTYVTGIQPLGGTGITLCATSSQDGSISIQRYADAAGAIAVGAVITQNTTGTTAACVAVNDGLPALYFQGSIVNGTGSTANITGAALIVSGIFP